MPDENRSRELFQAALQRTPECPPVEALERALDGADPRAAAHAESCAFCGAELQMLQSFRLAEIPPEDAPAVEEITRRLTQVTPAATPRPLAPRKPWWRFEGSWLRPAALAFAALLMVVGLTLQLRRGNAPALDSSGAAGSEVMRSRTMTILSPSGDLQAPPAEVRWEPVPSAVTYRFRLLEVDGNELWSTQTAATSTAFPPEVRARMAPAKTLLGVVTGLDAAGRKVAESETVRFRILQSLYGR